MSGFRKGFLLSTQNNNSSRNNTKKTTTARTRSCRTGTATTEINASIVQCETVTATVTPSLSFGERNKPITSSSALLEFEHDHGNDPQQQNHRNSVSSSSLLLVSPSQDTRLEDEPSMMSSERAGFGLLLDEIPPDTHAHNDDDNDNNHRNHCHDTIHEDSNQHDIGIQEIWSSKTISSSVSSGIIPSRVRNFPHGTNTLSGMATHVQEMEPFAADNKLQCQPLHHSYQPQILPLKTKPGSESVTSSDTVHDQEEPILTSTSSFLANPNSCLLLSRELTKTLLRRNQYDSFVSTYLTSPEAWIYTWPLVLKRIPKDSQELGTFMLLRHKPTGQSQQHPDEPNEQQQLQSSPLSTLIHVVLESKNQTREDKTVLLGAALLLNHVMKTNQFFQQTDDMDNNNNNKNKYQDKQQVLLPLLLHWVKIVQESQQCRTVLAREAILTAYGLLSHHNDDASFHTLLQIHEQWLCSTATTTKTIKRDSWRRQCTLTLIRDWKTIMKACPTRRSNNSTGTKSSKSQLEMSLYVGITITVGGMTIQNLGGMYQTLFDTPKLSVDTILLLLMEAKVSHSDRRRSIVRGILAVLSHDKAMWQQPESMNQAISELLSMLLPSAADCTSSEDDSDQLCTSLLIILLEASLPEQLDIHITMIVDALREQPDKAPRIGLPWSTMLWESQLVAYDRYTSVLDSVCRTMFAAPDQVAPLSLFGSLVDGKCHSGDRIRSGVANVLKSCSMQLEQGKHKDMYQRLAPLLLIRRIPSSVYMSIWEHDEPLSAELQNMITILATQLANILNETSTDVSPPERKLVAEIVGRCLPLDVTSPYSAFTIVLRPAFQNLIRAIQSGNTDIGNDIYRPAKIALYAACCHIPLTMTTTAATRSDAPVPPAILAVASFALWLLQPHNDDEELIECQRGCIEFFAACLTTDWHPTIAKGLQNLLTGNDNRESMGWSHTSNLAQIYGIPSSSDGRLESSPSVQTCIWNAYLLVSQRSPPDTLKMWATSTAPWILDWIDQHCSYPEELTEDDMVTGCALQVLFVLITRTKSLDCVNNDLQRVNRCIRRCLSRKDARLSSLKLLLAIIAVDVDRYQKDLGNDEAEQTLALVASVGQDDAEFCQLAKHLLVGIQSTTN